MTEQLINEILKSLAYGESAEDAAAANGVTVDEVNEIITNNAEQIENKKAELKEGGWYE